MQLVLDTRKAGKKRKSRLQKRFDKLCNALERERRRNARFRQDLDELVEVYQRRSIENDRVAFDDLVTLSEKLIVFAGRKSLSDWHRDELALWVAELIDRRIAPIDRQTSERLRQAYNEAVARSMDMTVDELVERIQGERDALGRDFGARDGAEPADGPGEEPWPPDEDSLQDDMFGFDDVDPEAFETDFETDFGSNGQDWMSDEEELGLGRKIMDGSWAKNLFRRAAQALHPDRELDPERRDSKQERMRELLKARKHGDIMAMLTIYSESVSSADIVLAEREMTEVCEALEVQLETLELEKQEYIYSHPARQLVFDLFYHSTTKVRKQKIREWERDLKQELGELRELVGYLRNLETLKRVLRDRSDERSTQLLADVLFDNIFDDIRF